MSGKNVLILFTDEHMRDAAGCYGHPIVRTPTLDSLAAHGVRFTGATTPSPVCVPARASLATGTYVHQNRCWGNAQPYDGSLPGWGHRLIEEGHRVVSVGKLHYRSSDDDNGFDEEILPLHVRDGVGWVHGLLRNEDAIFAESADFAHRIGPGEDGYSDFDRRVADAAQAWLRNEAPKHRDRPWVLFVSFLRPHYPLTCPADYFDLYPLDRIDAPRSSEPESLSCHPVVEGVRRFYQYDEHFDAHSRLVARASYYGLCSFVDDLMGQVLGALDDSGAADDTVVLYSSDHGESLGNHGLWTKCTMYEESVAIPMILAGPGIPEGKTIDTPVSLVDVHQTVLETTGLGLSAADAVLPGRSLLGIANGGRPQRTLLSEFHDGGSITGMFMIRHGRWKYIHYPGYASQLFDMENDPGEAHDLGESPAHHEVRRLCEARLRAIVDPDEANARAFGDQAARIEELGGVEAIRNTPEYDFTPVSGD